MKQQILVIEDEEIARRNLEHILVKEGYSVTAVENGIKGLHLLKTTGFDLIITDYKMEKIDGMQVLEKSRELQPYTEVIMITGYATVDSAVTAMKEGAYHYIAKPYKIDEVRKIVREALLKRSLRLENQALKDAMKEKGHLPFIIGNSAPMAEVKKMITQVAQVDTSILILGESGTGKELVAKSIHSQSSRHAHEMVAFNCGSFSEDLMANELFGHEKEAFTGAGKTKKGLFEIADKGTLFFDEIGDMPSSMQVKVLRVIQEKELMRVGGTHPVPVDLRFIAATHRDLKHEVEKGTFRQDLYYRLNVVTIQLPPLADRHGDIPLLAYHFLNKKNREMGKAVNEIDKTAMNHLSNYSWPGNVRELENVIERAVAMVSGDVIHPENLPDHITQLAIETYRSPSDTRIPTMREQEKKYIQWVLEKADWNKTKAAEIMGIDRVSLWRKIKTYKLE
ncbi:MAG: sigma-54 dependent transcriptional regulator [Pseudomonadota bacterium]